MDIMKTSLLVLFTSLCFNIYAQKPSHEVILKSGKKIRIEVVTKNSKKVTYWDDNGKRALILMSDIESISLQLARISNACGLSFVYFTSCM